MDVILWSRDVSNNKQVRGDLCQNVINIYTDLVWYHFHNFVNNFFVFNLAHLFNKYLCNVCSVLSSQILQLHFASFTNGLVSKGLNITAHTADRMLYQPRALGIYYGSACIFIEFFPICFFARMMQCQIKICAQYHNPF